MVERKNPGFNSLKERFTVDGENLITKFLENYTKSFVKGFASSKTAGAVLGTAVLSEVELPIAAVGALIQQGFGYFGRKGPLRARRCVLVF